MRIKEMSNQSRVYLHPKDYKKLLDNSVNDTAYISMRLAAECSLRIQEVSDIRVSDVRDTTELDTQVKFLCVRGKDTTGKSENGKLREVPIAPKLQDKLLDYMEEGIESGWITSVDDRVMKYKKRTLQKYIKETATATAEATGNDEFRKVSAHDFRAYFATNSLIRRDLNPRIVMEVGGWVDWKSIQPYLNAAFDDIIVNEFFGKPTVNGLTQE